MGASVSVAPFHVLVVEDEPLAAQLIARFLARKALRTSTAPGANTALRRLADDPADLIVTDLRMADGDGLHLIRTTREGNADLPIIVVTGQVLRDAEAEALAAGASLVLRKPVDLLALSEAVLAFRDAR